MIRIFTTLAVFQAGSLLAAFAVGVLAKLAPSDAGHVTHFALGLFASLLTLLVHCLVFTYLLGTGRWVKEVTLAYDLPDAPLHKKTRELKRRVYPVALIAMLGTIGAAAAGAGAQTRAWPWEVHASLAVAALLVNAWAYLVEYRGVRTNTEVLDQVMVEVDRICASRGLPSNAERLKEQESLRR